MNIFLYYISVRILYGDHDEWLWLQLVCVVPLNTIRSTANSVNPNKDLDNISRIYLSVLWVFYTIKRLLKEPNSRPYSTAGQLQIRLIRKQSKMWRDQCTVSICVWSEMLLKEFRWSGKLVKLEWVNRQVS